MGFKAYSKWTAWEHGTLLRMKGEGATNRQIALAVGRSHNAVTSRITHRYRCAGHREPIPVPEPPRTVVAKHELPEWYALGWRVASFADGACAIEWRYQSEPSRPAARIEVEPVREREAA